MSQIDGATGLSGLKSNTTMRCKVRSLIRFLVCAFGLLEECRGQPARSQGPPLNTRESVVRWLKHSEGLVQSADCEMEFRVLPTRPEMLPLIREVCAANGQRPEQFFIDDSFVRKNSYACKWLRKGDKERFERVSADGVRQVQSYDGQIVRLVAQRDGNTTGSINTTQSASWSTANRVHPFSLVYLYYEKPYSHWVQQGVDFRSSTEERDGQTLTRVSVSDPMDPRDHRITLIFDAEGRVVERQKLRKLPSDPRPFVREIHVLTDYEAFSNPSGETIWFPRRAVYNYNMGVHASGALAEYMSEEIQIKSIHFNLDIPDGAFELRIPRDAKVWDGVTGLGWLEPGDRPETLFPEETRRQRWITYGVVAIAVLSTMGVALYKRRKPSRLGNKANSRENGKA